MASVLYRRGTPLPSVAVRGSGSEDPRQRRVPQGRPARVFPRHLPLSAISVSPPICIPQNGEEL